MSPSPDRSPVGEAGRLTGRIRSAPSRLLHDEVLEPQFRYEAAYLLPWYTAVEKVFALEYRRMGLITASQAAEIGRLLHGAARDGITADPQANMSDIAFALEQYVERGLSEPVAAWHVDRSRNDMQSTAQLLFGRQLLLDGAESVMEFGLAAHRLATLTTDLPMVGQTHLQAAQTITPGYYFAAVSQQMAHTLRRLLTTHDGINLSPLGSGAMTGQDLPWDRDAMAALLGCRGPQPHALTGVASRAWVLEIAAEVSLLGSSLSRFVSDVMTWGSGPYGYLALPDELSGISSAMPQKKNYPVLERIRGKSAHLSAYYLDMLLAQRATPFTNMVEVSKEAGANLLPMFTTLGTTMRLFTAVVENLGFDEDRMRSAVEQEFLGGFTLANQLTLRESVPWRTAQVIAGRYILAAHAAGLPPHRIAPDLLRTAAAEHGVTLADPETPLATAFRGAGELYEKRSAGSAHPDRVRELLDEQGAEYRDLRAEWSARRERAEAGLGRIDALLGLDGGADGGRGAGA
ncbi:argininosuccinate lyase [Streptomyces lavendofoliae]|uniref:argininosuccinate lyase n=1 Tax=Streptomyces lavendofoliae TaxID=67314 RepID=A0A918HZ56_9ACTN|nr:lyase family protein [Streptomyces lavendofoliae]GGU46659.1 argininosuccinate lyase [Streptomyces lavendofoliae]